MLSDYGYQNRVLLSIPCHLHNIATIQNTHAYKQKCSSENFKFIYIQRLLSDNLIKENKGKVCFSVSASYWTTVKLQTSLSTILEKIRLDFLQLELL